MDRSTKDPLEFAQALMLRPDIADLTRSVERAINAECHTPDDLVATLTLNYVAAVIGMAKSTQDMTNTINLMNTVISRAVRIREAELALRIANPTTVH